MNEKSKDYLGLELEGINSQNVSEIIEELEKKYELVHSPFSFNEQTLFHLRFKSKNKSLSEMEIIYKSLHDLKQPVSIIGSFTQLLERKLKADDKLDEKDQSFLNYINQGVNRLNHLMKSLSEFSKVQQEIEKHPYAFKEILAQVNLSYDKTFSQEDINFNCKIDPSFIVNCDKEQLIILLQKVIDNSILFRAENRSLDINLSAQEEDNKTLLSLSDNGVGIEEENLNNIFDIYTKFYENEDQKSSGLGLATAKQIVENHNGQIWYESTKGVGTNVFIRI